MPVKDIHPKHLVAFCVVGAAVCFWLSSCAVGRPRPTCENPVDCAPPHRSGGEPVPNIMRPLERGQFIRVYPSGLSSPHPSVK